MGSSILILYDDTKVGAWLIDFAKTREVPEDITLNHRVQWEPGNHEEGFLFGLDNLIKVNTEICFDNNYLMICSITLLYNQPFFCIIRCLERCHPKAARPMSLLLNLWHSSHDCQVLRLFSCRYYLLVIIL